MRIRNLKSIADSTIQFQRLTVLIGPNGCGKSSVLRAVHAVPNWPGRLSQEDIRFDQRSLSAQVTVGDRTDERCVAEFVIDPRRTWSNPRVLKGVWPGDIAQSRPRLFSLVSTRIAETNQLQKGGVVSDDGYGLSNALDQLRDRQPEVFEELNEILPSWFPEFDRVLFDTPQTGHRQFSLRTRIGKHAVPASQLSDGTLLAFFVFALQFIEDRPRIICMEEPEHGVHPHLLERIKDALLGIAYSTDPDRRAQVVVTTHSPYLLDALREHPECIVIASKSGLESSFTRLSDSPEVLEALGCQSLGSLWYTGVLGGTPE